MNAIQPADQNDAIFDTADRNGGYEHAGRETPLVREYLGILERRKWVILAIVALALLAGLVLTLMATPQYTASSRIEISRQDQRVTNVEGLEESDRRFDQEFYDTQYELLAARSVGERVARELRLANNFAFFEAHGLDPETTPWLGSEDAATSRETLETRRKAAVGLLLGHISISPIPRSALVDISYTSANATLSAQIANEWG
ncbi:MAG: Wzz/FepE/Etk N-terminal domain-containing protein, partial [Pseudomonadota bacterium]